LPLHGGIERVVQRRQLGGSADERRAGDSNHRRIIGPGYMEGAEGRGSASR
jgi:hypothetical protein